MIKHDYEYNTMIDLLRVIATLCVFMLHVSIFSSSAYGFSFTNKSWFLQTPAWSAVWVFFVLSGYANGKSFASGKYVFRLRDIIRFYYRRFIRVILPCWIFTLFALLLVETDFLCENPNIILKIITLSYYNNPDNASIGATWYVYSIAWLYILTPIIARVLSPLVKYRDKTKWIILICTTAVGLLIRLATIKIGVEWQKIYVAFYMNLDLYIAGIIVAHMNHRERIVKSDKIGFLVAGLIGLLVINTRLYYVGNTLSSCLLIYQYVFPSVWLIFTSVYILISSAGGYVLKLPKYIEKKLRIFSETSFYFYLVHSMIAAQIAPIFTGIKSAALSHVLLLFFTGALAFVMSLLMRNGMELKER